jgi:hypothetical protein
MASGWTGSLISPDQRVHAATALALDHVGQRDVAHAMTNPAHPDHQSILSSMVLRDPTLGSRSIGGAQQPPPGTPVGSAAVSANAGSIPATIQSAINNLNTNTQSSTVMSILNRVLGAGSGGVNQVAATSPAQDEYFRSQTALNNQKLAAQAAPGNLLNQINANLANNPNPMGPMSIAPSPIGSYTGSQRQANDAALQNLYGQFNVAKQAASGWTAPIY